MQASRFQWDQIIIAVAIVLAAVWAAIQWTAWQLGFPPQLGNPWFYLWRMPVYPPPAFFWWWLLYDAYAPAVFSTGAAIAASGGILSALLTFVLASWRGQDGNADTYGSARWATPAEVGGAPACLDGTASCSAATRAPTCGTTGRSTCCALHRLDPARASGWSFPPS
jgi:type IV secretion system protein VirD4